jgi:hypothetical protein
MDYMMAPLKITLAGIRLTGYMIETQCRVAQVLGQAALEASPYYRAAKPVVKRRAEAEKAGVRSPARTAPVNPSGKKTTRQPSAPPMMPCGNIAEVRPS